MVHDSDDLVSLPAPPPPNPAARRSAIDAALRKFDGVEESPHRRATRTRPGFPDWASTHRRATGALVTAALIAVVSIPAIEVALRDHRPEAALEELAPNQQQASQAVPDLAARAEPAVTADQSAVTSRPTEPQAAAPEVAKPRNEFVETKAARAADVAPPASIRLTRAAPAVLAPPPSPPAPPPSPQAEREAADAAESGSIVVTGTLMRAPNMESAAPVTAIDPYSDFLASIRAAFRTNDRRAVIRLIDFPLEVNFAGDVRTYRSRKDVERDFDNIFTAEVKASVLNQGYRQPKRRGEEGLTVFGALGVQSYCSRKPCPPDSPIRIRRVNP